MMGGGQPMMQQGFAMQGQGGMMVMGSQPMGGQPMVMMGGQQMMQPQMMQPQMMQAGYPMQQPILMQPGAIPAAQIVYLTPENPWGSLETCNSILIEQEMDLMEVMTGWVIEIFK